MNKLIDLADEALKKINFRNKSQLLLVFPKNRYTDFSFKLSSSQPVNGLRLK